MFEALRVRPSAGNALAAIVFVAVVMSSLVVQSQFFFHESVLPFTDFASNDILVTRAKHLMLWHGNYSRVGFYHPGPFFFQLMAWSEIAFFEYLHVFHSYFAAQVFAVVCLSALALALVAKLLYACTGRVGSALIGVSLFVVVLRLAEAYSFWNPWPPYLYVTAATILITGLCGVILVGWSWLPWAVLGAGALVHGHASFVGLVPVILGVTIVGAWLAARKGVLPSMRSALLEKGTIIICLLLVAILLTPLVLQTFVHWPGEFPKYFAFAGHRESNAMMAVIRYVLDFMPYWAIVLPFAVLVAWLMRGSKGATCIIGATLMMLAGIAAAGLYARKGVDGLEYRYLEYWFAPFYAMFVAMVGACFINWSQRFHPAVINVLAGLTIACASVVTSKSPEWVQQPASVPIQPYRQTLETIANSSDLTTELVLDRSNGAWDASWSDSVSLLAYANRAMPDLRLCVANESWHLLFHEQYRCSGSGPRRRLFVSNVFYPDRHQVTATANARYYEAAGSVEVPSGDASQAGDTNLRSDIALKPMEVAVILRLRGEPTLDATAKWVNVHLLVTNRGNKPLAGLGKVPVNLAVVQLPHGAGGAQATPRVELQRMPVPGVVPGGVVEMSLSLPATSFDKGSVVRLELVQEGVGWFTYDYGLPPLDLGPLQVCADNPRQLCKVGG